MQPAPGAWFPEGLTLLAFPNVSLVALVAQYLLGDLLDELEHLLRHRFAPPGPFWRLLFFQYYGLF